MHMNVSEEPKRPEHPDLENNSGLNEPRMVPPAGERPGDSPAPYLPQALADIETRYGLVESLSVHLDPREYSLPFDNPWAKILTAELLTRRDKLTMGSIEDILSDVGIKIAASTINVRAYKFRQIHASKAEDYPPFLRGTVREKIGVHAGGELELLAKRVADELQRQRIRKRAGPKTRSQGSNAALRSSLKTTVMTPPQDAAEFDASIKYPLYLRNLVHALKDRDNSLADIQILTGTPQSVLTEYMREKRMSRTDLLDYLAKKLK